MDNKRLKQIISESLTKTDVLVQLHKELWMRRQFWLTALR